MIRILEEKFDASRSIDDKVTLLQGLENFQILDSPNDLTLNRVLTKITESLEQSKTSRDGLLLLHSLLGQCSEGTFTNCAVKWARSVVEILKMSGAHSKDLACLVLKNIILNGANHAMVKKEIGEKLMPQIVPALIEKMSKGQEIKYAADCLVACMKTLPKYCNSQEKIILEFVWKQLNSAKICDKEIIAELFVHLPDITEKGDTQNIYMSYWCNLVETLLNCLNSSINFLYKDTHIPQIAAQEFSEDEPEEEFARVLFHARRFQTVIHCLLALFCSESKFAVRIPVTSLLQTISRGMFITLKDLITVRTCGVESVLPLIHVSSLMLLEVLMIMCPNELIRHEPTISNIIFECLCTQFINHPRFAPENRSSILRCAAYRLTRLWIEKLGRAPTFQRDTGDLYYEILNDIVPDHMKANGPTSTDQSRESRALICIEALQLVSTLCNAKMLPCENISNLKMDIYSAITQVILFVQTKAFQIAPYCNDSCRLQMYKTFLKLICGSVVSSLTSVASGIFFTGRLDCSLEISRFCVDAIKICTRLIQTQSIQAFSPSSMMRPETSSDNPVDTISSTPARSSSSLADSSYFQSTSTDKSNPIQVANVHSLASPKTNQQPDDEMFDYEDDEEFEDEEEEDEEEEEEEEVQEEEEEEETEQGEGPEEEDAELDEEDDDDGEEGDEEELSVIEDERVQEDEHVQEDERRESVEKVNDFVCAEGMQEVDKEDATPMEVAVQGSEEIIGGLFGVNVDSSNFKKNGEMPAEKEQGYAADSCQKPDTITNNVMHFENAANYQQQQQESKATKDDVETIPDSDTEDVATLLVDKPASKEFDSNNQHQSKQSRKNGFGSSDEKDDVARPPKRKKFAANSLSNSSTESPTVAAEGSEKGDLSDNDDNTVNAMLQDFVIKPSEL